MTWTMQDELTFIDHIGEWTNKGKGLTVAEKLHLLRGYRQGLNKRTAMVGLDRAALEKYIQKQIDSLSDKEPNALV
jgi:hypothetical protein